MAFPRALYPCLVVLAFSCAQLPAALVLNGGANPAITQQVTVQPIVVSDDGGGNTATFLGTGAQQTTILNLIDQIWAQAGIDVAWLAPTFWNNTFANVGNSDPRPSADLLTVRSQGDAAGVGNANPFVLDLYFVRLPAGFSLGDLATNSTAGLGVVGGNGIMVFVGSSLPSIVPGGQEAIASVIAHEIGHNLGLPHVALAQNLMQEGGSPNPGHRLSAEQVTAALNSNLSLPIGVPEPGTFLLLSLVLPLAIRARRFTSV